MRTVTNLAVATVLALCVSSAAWAQHIPGSAPAPAVAPVGHASSSASASSHSGKAGTHTVHGANTARVNGSTGTHTNGGLGTVRAEASYGGYDYGLGALDFGNSASNQDLAIKALIDPVTEARLAFAARTAGYARGTSFVPVYWGPGYYSDDSSAAAPTDSGANGSEAEGEQGNNDRQQPQIIVLQPAQQGANNSSSENEPAAEPQPKLPDVGEFTLIFKNGKQALAVAYTRQGDRVVYVTKDGVRHYVDVSSIDVTASQRVNEESGASFQL